MYKIFFPFSFSFSIENETPLLPPPFFFHFGGGFSAASPLEIWDVMPPYLKTLFEKKKQKFDNFDHFRPDDPLKLVLGKNPMRTKSHVGKNPMRKKSQRKKSHEDKIPEDKIPKDKIPSGKNPM